VTGGQTVASVFVVRDDRIRRAVRYDDLANALYVANLDGS